MPLKTETVERSVKRIGKVHLKALGKIARDDISSLLSKSDRFRRAYRGRLFAITLCQGAATHYLDGKNGVKDFDVWKNVFDKFESVRKEGGERSAFVLRHADDPNMVTIINTWDTIEVAQAFFGREELKTAMGEAGVTAPPTFIFANEV